MPASIDAVPPRSLDVARPIPFERLWTDPRGWALLVLAAMLPFAFVTVPPLHDLPSHMARYHIADAIDRSAALQRFYTFDWALIGNLGVDLLVYALTPLLGIKRATWLVVALIPPLTIVGILWVAREWHGRVPATALLALPAAYTFPFQMGFVNFCLAVALGLNALALWLRAADWRPVPRAALFAALSLVLWLCHLAGWAAFALAVGGLELARAWQAERGPPFRRLPELAMKLAPLAVPFIVMWLTMGGEAAPTAYHENAVRLKVVRFISMFRDQSFPLDIATFFTAALLPFLLVRQRLARLDAGLLVPAGLLMLAFILLPRQLVGSFYADVRLLPMAAILLALGLRWQGSARAAGIVAVAALALFSARLTLMTVGWRTAEAAHASHRRAIEHIPHGARLLVLQLRDTSGASWPVAPIDHVPSFATLERDAFVNIQWAFSGGQLLQVKYNRDIRYHKDPSGVLVVADATGRDTGNLQAALATFPRDRFDFVWLMNTQALPTAPSRTAGLRPIYADGNTLLLRVDRTIDHASSTGRTS